MAQKEPIGTSSDSDEYVIIEEIIETSSESSYVSEQDESDLNFNIFPNNNGLHNFHVWNYSFKEINKKSKKKRTAYKRTAYKRDYYLKNKDKWVLYNKNRKDKLRKKRREEQLKKIKPLLIQDILN